MSNIDCENYSYGCIFCLTGKEQFLADRICTECPHVLAVVPKREKPMTRKGRKFREAVIMMPGYVFFKAPSDANPWWEFPKTEGLRLMTGVGNLSGWQLAGRDKEFAEKIFHYNGLISFSKACKEGDFIRIISGPLKDLEGVISKVDKRGHSMQVRLQFQNREIPVWLGYDLIDVKSHGQEASFEEKKDAPR